ncbi:MAG: hypothetical protein M0T85_04785 [Dehalococcoidales bacterium]|nr:hypothetical protein [Dehalococcoidales bacterium]
MLEPGNTLQLDLFNLEEPFDSGMTTERSSLEARYQPLMREDLRLGKLVTYVSNKSEPVFGWFRYKEGFSRYLVDQILQKEWQLPQEHLVFDPFAGCGTTLLACQYMGYPALGIDIMPIAIFIAKVKLAHFAYDIPALEKATEQLLSREYTPTGKSWPKVQIVDLAFSREVQDKLLFYRDRIQEFDDHLVRDFLMLALLASVEEASATSKDGQFLRIVDRPPKALEFVLAANLNRMLGDLRSERLGTTQLEEKAKAIISLGDARRLPGELSVHQGRVSGVVTSPPYLNRYDYSRTYALELCLMYGEDGNPCVRDFDDLKSLRHSLLRSHIESKPAPTNLVQVPAIREVLNALRLKRLNNARIPIMIEGYFEDMNLVLEGLSRMLMPGGRVALVVANARFEGEMVPTDLILSEIAASHGLETTEIRITRYKGNSSQQMGRYGRVPVRESIVFWQKSRS